MLTSNYGQFKMFSSGADILNKLWTHVQVEPLSYEELQEVFYIQFFCANNLLDSTPDVCKYSFFFIYISIIP